jgi:hypothetical protein
VPGAAHPAIPTGQFLFAGAAPPGPQERQLTSLSSMAPFWPAGLGGTAPEQVGRAYWGGADLCAAAPFFDALAPTRLPRLLRSPPHNTHTHMHLHLRIHTQLHKPPACTHDNTPLPKPTSAALFYSPPTPAGAGAPASQVSKLSRAPQVRWRPQEDDALRL